MKRTPPAVRTSEPMGRSPADLAKLEAARSESATGWARVELQRQDETEVFTYYCGELERYQRIGPFMEPTTSPSSGLSGPSRQWAGVFAEHFNGAR